MISAHYEAKLRSKAPVDVRRTGHLAHPTAAGRSQAQHRQHVAHALAPPRRDAGIVVEELLLRWLDSGPSLQLTIIGSNQRFKML